MSNVTDVTHIWRAYECFIFTSNVVINSVRSRRYDLHSKRAGSGEFLYAPVGTIFKIKGTVSSTALHGCDRRRP